MIKVGIIGATGYAGSELVRILLGHKDVEIKWYGSRSYIDKKYASIYQNFFQLVDANCMDDNMEVLADQVEELILDRETMETKKKLGSQFAQVVYEGKWFTPLREAIQAFVESTQKYVTGEVKFKLYKGNIIKAGTTSPYSLYNESLASFTTGDMYDHHDADGFITLFGLPLKVRALMMQEVKNNNK